MAASSLIMPFDGVDGVRFGMSREQVAQVAGDAEDVRHKRILGLTLERRGASEFEFDDATGTLNSIYMFKPGRGKGIRERLSGASYVPVFYDGIETLDTDGFAKLCEREQTKEGIGNVGVLFPELGFLVAGFRKRVPEGRYVLAFSREMLEFYEEDWLNV